MAAPPYGSNSTMTSSSSTVWWTATTASTTPSSDAAAGSSSPASTDTASGTSTGTFTATLTGTSTAIPTGLNGTSINGTSDSTGSQTSNSDGKFNTGTLAGAVVGSFLGGCLLAFLAAFLFFRRKKPQTGDSGAWAAADKAAPAKSVEAVSSYASTPLPASAALAGAATALDLAPFVSQPAEDSFVCMRVQVLLDQIGLHIDNYYARTTSNPPLTSDIVARMGGYDSSNLPASIATMLSNPKAQRPVLIHVLAQSALQAIQPGTHGLSLLPACYTLAPQRERVDNADTNTTHALFAWRMLTFHLNGQTQPTLPNDTYLQTDSIAQFAENFTKAFAPYSSAEFTEAERLRHMNSVGKMATDLGIWLFSQPCSIEFRWNGKGLSPDEIVTNPAIVKVADEHGQRLAVPQILAGETTVRI